MRREARPRSASSPPWPSPAASGVPGRRDRRGQAGPKRTEAGLPASSFRDLLDALATLTRNRIRLAGHDVSFDQLAEQTPLQRRALELLHVNPNSV